MCRIVPGIIGLFGLLTLGAGVAKAGLNANSAIVFHVTPVTTTDACLSSHPIPGCANLHDAEPALGVPVYTYILVENSDATAGIGAARFGLDYSAAPPLLQVWNWTLCADNQVSSGWPAPHSGLEVSWSPGNCQHRMTGTGNPFFDTGAAVIGYLYMTAYVPSQLAIIPHPQNSMATLTDCSGAVDDLTSGFPSHLGVAGFGGAQGYSPCGQNPHEAFCTIYGPDHVEAGSTHQYASDVPYVSNSWNIIGNGVIVGPDDQNTVTVQAAGPGTFYLQHVGYPGYSPPTYVCYETVTVTDATATRSTSWSGIKALYR